MVGDRSARLATILTCWIVVMVAHGAAVQAQTLTTLTDEERAWLQAHDNQLELWHETGFPPVEFQSDDGEFIGLGADMVALVEQRLGTRFVRHAGPDWGQILQALEEGPCAMVPVAVPTAERQVYARFTKPYIEIPVVIIGTASLGRDLSLADLSGRRVAVVQDYVTEDHVRRAAQGRFEVVGVDRVEQGLEAVALGQVDAYVESLAAASYLIASRGMTNLIIAGRTDLVYTQSMAVSRRFPLLFSAVQKALDDISADELAAIRSRWIPLAPPSGLTPETKNLLMVSGAFLVLLIVALFIISSVLRNRLEQRTAEVVKSEAGFRALFEHAPVPLIEMSRDGRTLAVNDAATRSLGYTLESLPDLDTWWRKAFPHSARRREAQLAWAADIEAAASTGDTAGPREFTIRRPDGSDNVYLIGANVVDERFVVSLIDIDERKRMMDELATSRRRFQDLFDLAPFSCVITDAEGRFLLANKHFCETAGRTLDEILGKTNADLGRINDPAKARSIMDEIRANGICSMREITLDDQGKTLHVMFSSRVIDWEDGQAILSATVDITQRRRAEEEVRRQEENLRVTLESIGDAVIATDTEGRVTRMNRIAEALTGWTRQDATGRPLAEVFRIIHEQTRAVAEDPVTKVLATGQIVELADHTVLLSRDDREYRIADSGAPIRDGEETIIGVVLVFRDVTEEHRQQEELQQSRKLQAVGQLAGGVAHDFNNMLGAILGAAELLAAQETNLSERRRHLATITQAAERAADLTRDLLAFSRKQPTRMAPLSLQQIVADARSILEHSADPRIRIETHMPDQTLSVIGDAAQLQNAVLNLLINATHAMPDGGLLTVTAAAADDDQVLLSVRDTGHGIAPEHLQRIFEPFFTTKDAGEGTGLGLSAVLGTVQEHGGDIQVDSQPGQGTRFDIRLPRADQEPSPLKPPAAVEPVQGEERILVVDDEAMLRNITARMLRKHGYTVDLAENGREALDVFTAAGGAHDLVILDMSMPEMNGAECLAELLRIRPDVRVVLSSGYASDVKLSDEQWTRLAGFLDKPFRSESLLAAVRQALDRN